MVHPVLEQARLVVAHRPQGGDGRSAGATQMKLVLGRRGPGPGCEGEGEGEREGEREGAGAWSEEEEPIGKKEKGDRGKGEKAQGRGSGASGKRKGKGRRAKTFVVSSDEEDMKVEEERGNEHCGEGEGNVKGEIPATNRMTKGKGEGKAKTSGRAGGLHRAKKQKGSAQYKAGIGEEGTKEVEEEKDVEAVAGEEDPALAALKEQQQRELRRQEALQELEARREQSQKDFAKLSAGKPVHGFFASVAARRLEAAAAAASAAAAAAAAATAATSASAAGADDICTEAGSGKGTESAPGPGEDPAPGQGTPLGYPALGQARLVATLRSRGRGTSCAGPGATQMKLVLGRRGPGPGCEGEEEGEGAGAQSEEDEHAGEKIKRGQGKGTGLSSGRGGQGKGKGKGKGRKQRASFASSDEEEEEVEEEEANEDFSEGDSEGETAAPKKRRAKGNGQGKGKGKGKGKGTGNGLARAGRLARGKKRKGAGKDKAGDGEEGKEEGKEGGEDEDTKEVEEEEDPAVVALKEQQRKEQRKHEALQELEAKREQSQKDFAKLSAGKPVHGFFASAAMRRTEIGSVSAFTAAAAGLCSEAGSGREADGTAPGEAIPLPHPDGSSADLTARGRGTQGASRNARGLWPLPPCHIAQLAGVHTTGVHDSGASTQREEAAALTLPRLHRDAEGHNGVRHWSASQAHHGFDLASLEGSVTVPFIHQWGHELRGSGNSRPPQGMGAARAASGTLEATARGMALPGEEAENCMWSDRWAPSTLDEVCADPAAKMQLQQWMWGCIPPRLRSTAANVAAAGDAEQACELGQEQRQEMSGAWDKEGGARGEGGEEGRGQLGEEAAVQRSQRGRLLSPRPVWGFGLGRGPKKAVRQKAGLGLCASGAMNGVVVGSQTSCQSLSQSWASDSFIDDGEEGSEDMWSGGEEEAGGGRGRGSKKGAARGLAQHVLLLIGPPGCGKTSSVYACATDLGFRVVELNASDTRSGPEVRQKYGELLESHRLGCRQRAATPQQAGEARRAHVEQQEVQAQVAEQAEPGSEAQRELGEGTKGTAKGGSTEEEGEEGAKAAAAAAERCTGSERNAAPGTPQGPVVPGSSPDAPPLSLLLVEDVDVVMEEDRGFWGALVALASAGASGVLGAGRQGHRPIVLTSSNPGAAGLLPSELCEHVIEMGSPSDEQMAQLALTAAMAASQSVTGAESGDAGPSDSGPSGAGPTDAGPTGGGPRGAGRGETGPTDAEPADGGHAGAGPGGADSLVPGGAKEPQGDGRPDPALGVNALRPWLQAVGPDPRAALLQLQFWLQHPAAKGQAQQRALGGRTQGHTHGQARLSTVGTPAQPRVWGRQPQANASGSRSPDSDLCPVYPWEHLWCALPSTAAPEGSVSLLWTLCATHRLLPALFWHTSRTAHGPGTSEYAAPVDPAARGEGSEGRIAGGVPAKSREAGVFAADVAALCLAGAWEREGERAYRWSQAFGAACEAEMERKQDEKAAAEASEKASRAEARARARLAKATAESIRRAKGKEGKGRKGGRLKKKGRWARKVVEKAEEEGEGGREREEEGEGAGAEGEQGGPHQMLLREEEAEALELQDFVDEVNGTIGPCSDEGPIAPFSTEGPRSCDAEGRGGMGEGKEETEGSTPRVSLGPATMATDDGESPGGLTSFGRVVAGGSSEVAGAQAGAEAVFEGVRKPARKRMMQCWEDEEEEEEGGEGGGREGGGGGGMGGRRRGEEGGGAGGGVQRECAVTEGSEGTDGAGIKGGAGPTGSEVAPEGKRRQVVSRIWEVGADAVRWEHPYVSATWQALRGAGFSACQPGSSLRDPALMALASSAVEEAMRGVAEEEDWGLEEGQPRAVPHSKPSADLRGELWCEPKCGHGERPRAQVSAEPGSDPAAEPEGEPKGVPVPGPRTAPGGLSPLQPSGRAGATHGKWPNAGVFPVCRGREGTQRELLPKWGCKGGDKESLMHWAAALATVHSDGDCMAGQQEERGLGREERDAACGTAWTWKEAPEGDVLEARPVQGVAEAHRSVQAADHASEEWMWEKETEMYRSLSPYVFYNEGEGEGCAKVAAGVAAAGPLLAAGITSLAYQALAKPSPSGPHSLSSGLRPGESCAGEHDRERVFESNLDTTMLWLNAETVAAMCGDLPAASWALAQAFSKVQ